MAEPAWRKIEARKRKQKDFFSFDVCVVSCVLYSMRAEPRDAELRYEVFS